MRGNLNFLHQSSVHEEGLVSHDNSMDGKLSCRPTDWLCFPEIKIATSAIWNGEAFFSFQTALRMATVWHQSSCKKPKELTRTT